MRNDTMYDPDSPRLPGALEGLFAGGNPLAAVSDLVASARQELAEQQVEGLAGGGAVRISMNGERRVTAVAIAPEAFEAGDRALLEELVLAAANDAFERAGALKPAALEAFSGLFGAGPA